MGAHAHKVGSAARGAQGRYVGIATIIGESRSLDTSSGGVTSQQGRS